MAKVLLTWEGGLYFGHEFKVTAAAAVMRAAGHQVVIVAPWGVPPNAAALRLGARWENLSAGPPQALPAAPVAWQSRASVLWRFGFQSEEVLSDRFRAWDAVFQREQPDLVFLESAPFAQVTAHAVGVRSVEFGVGFDVPPASAPFPPFRDADAFDPEQALRLERRMAELLARVVGHAARGRELHEWVAAPLRLVTSIPELDHYEGHADASRQFIGPLPNAEFDAVRPGWGRPGPRILAYVRAGLLDMTAFQQAVAALRGDGVVICPDATPEHVDQAHKLKLRLHRQPVSLGDLLPKADLLISHAGGTMADALLRGRPCVALPSHYEQFITSRLLARRRLAVVADPAEPAGFERALRRALGDAELRRNAAALALRHRGAVLRAAEALRRAAEGG